MMMAQSHYLWRSFLISVRKAWTKFQKTLPRRGSVRVMNNSLNQAYLSCTSNWSYNMLEHVATTKCPGQAQYFRHFSTLQRQHGDHVAGDRGARKIKLTFCREELYADCRLIAAYCSCSVSLTLKKHCARQGSSLTSNSASASGNPKTHSC